MLPCPNIFPASPQGVVRPGDKLTVFGYRPAQDQAVAEGWWSPELFKRGMLMKRGGVFQVKLEKWPALLCICLKRCASITRPLPPPPSPVATLERGGADF